MFTLQVFLRIGRKPSLSCSLRVPGVDSDCLIPRPISRQFIARYVHDLIVKHNVRNLSGDPD
jgi:hypothetical protein